MWEIEYTDEFEGWWHGLTEKEQIDIAATVGLLEQCGTNLKHPYSSGIEGSQYRHMRELRVVSLIVSYTRLTQDAPVSY